MPRETVLFTLHMEMTFPRLFLGIAIAGLIVLFMAALVKKIINDAEDRGYEQGFDACVGQITDDMVDDIYDEIDLIDPPFGIYPEDC